MSEETIFDIAIIGSGPGGYHSAIRAGSFGAKIALIEKDERLGGTCSNRGCIPTKALYSSAGLIADIKEKAESFGITVGSMTTDFGKAVERKNQIVEELTAGIAGLCKQKGVEIFHGHGSIVEGSIESGFTLEVKGETTSQIKAKRVIIATGSTPANIPAFNIDHKRILDSDDILDYKNGFNTAPKSIIVIGGGVIGCEFANIFAEFGSKVTILEYMPGILVNEEKPIVKYVKKTFQHLEIDINVSQNVVSVENTEDGIKATTCAASVPRDEVGAAEKTIFEAEICLVSIGRSKVTDGLNLDKFNIGLERGAITVNKETYETSTPGVYAIGDVNGIFMLAHVASYMGDVAVYNCLDSIGGFDGVHVEKADLSTVPATTFTHPNIGSVGLKQKEAKAKYGKILVGRFMYAASGKAKCMGVDGMMMVIADKESDKIVGASCVGASAAQLISEIAVAMKNGFTTHQIGSVIHSHPTLSEIVLEAVEDCHGMAIHKGGKRK